MTYWHSYSYINLGGTTWCSLMFLVIFNLTIQLVLHVTTRLATIDVSFITKDGLHQLIECYSKWPFVTIKFQFKHILHPKKKGKFDLYHAKLLMHLVYNLMYFFLNYFGQANIIRITQQLRNFQTYQDRVSALIGPQETQSLVNKALVLITLGGNDYVNNYFLMPITARKLQYSISQFTRYIIAEYRKILMVNLLLTLLLYMLYLFSWSLII